MSEPVNAITTRARARVGTVLKEKWRLERLLGVGGMAAVYAATHRNGATGAIKVLHLELSIDPNIRQRFLREGYVANSVKHRGAVSVLDDDVGEDGAPFLVMELLEGETLEARSARESTLPPGDVLAIADQLLDVLAAAHAAGIVHRDIKPENVFLTGDGVVKVLDFGIARLLELSSGTGATKTGATLGTPAFMAPEQARGLWDEVDARSDLWSVGATLFTLLTGRLVHEGRTVNEQLLAAMTRPVDSLALIRPDLPRPVVDVVDRAVAFEKERRWSDAATMREAVRAATATIASMPPDLAHAASTARGPAPESTTVAAVARDGRTITSSRGDSHGRRTLAALVGALLIALLALAAFTQRSGDRATTTGLTSTNSALGASADGPLVAPASDVAPAVEPIGSDSPAPRALRIEDLPNAAPPSPVTPKVRAPAKVPAAAGPASGSAPAPQPPPAMPSSTESAPAPPPPDRRKVLDRRD